MEAAWSYQRRPWIGGYLLRRQRNLDLSDEVREIAWKAQYRLHKRYTKLTSGRAHEKENPRAFYAVRPPGPTRAPSPRQLPTDHDPAVPTRVYQSDQSSLSVHRCHLP